MLAAALKGASLNVTINTNSMKDREAAAAYDEKAAAMLAEFVPRAEKVFEEVRGTLAGK